MKEKEDNGGGRGQGCWIMAEETMQEQDRNYWM